MQEIGALILNPFLFNFGWKDCQESSNGSIESRRIYPENGISENVFCLSGWILIQQRKNTHIDDFDRGWREFARGFEDWGEETYWMGLEKMHKLTSVRKKVGCSTDSLFQLTASFWKFVKKFLDSKLLTTDLDSASQVQYNCKFS